MEIDCDPTVVPMDGAEQKIAQVMKMRICRAFLTAAMSRHSFRDGNNSEKTRSRVTNYTFMDAGCHMSPWLRIFGVTQTA